jgi:hypothetical protein
VPRSLATIGIVGAVVGAEEPVALGVGTGVGSEAII